jgi:hypothetical protein
LIVVFSKEEDASKLQSLLGCFAFTFVLMSSLIIVAVPAAAVPQTVTLTFTSSTNTAYPVEAFTINATASAPITGPVKLQWTINGSGPYTWNGQMTNGFFEREWGCASVGNWTLWLVWEGNETHSPALSNAVSILVTAPPAEDTPTSLIVVGVILLVAVIGGVAYLSSKRKKK